MGDLRNFYKNAADKGIINKDVKYEDFEKAMRDEKERKSFYEYATSNGLKIGAPERFDEYVSAHLTPSETTAATAQPTQQPQTQQSTTNPTNGQEQQQAATQQTQQPANQKDYRDLQFRMQMGNLQNKINNYQPQVDIPKRQTFAEKLGEINNYALEQRRADPHAIAERTIRDAKQETERLHRQEYEKWQEAQKKQGVLADITYSLKSAQIGSPAPLPYNEDPYIKAAEHLLLQAENRMKDTKTGEYKFGDYTANTLRHLLESQEGIATFGLSDVSEALALKGVFDKLDDENKLDNPASVLNEKEMALYNAYVSTLAAEFARYKDTSAAASAGKITADMLQFIEEMALQSGLWSGLNRAAMTKMSRYLTRKIAEKALSKTPAALAKTGTKLMLNTTDLALRAGETGVTSLLLPRTYANMISNQNGVANTSDAIQFDGYKLRIGDLEQNTTADAFRLAWRDQWKEMFTETGGVFKFGGKMLFNNPITRKVFNQVGKTKFGKILDGINKGLKNKGAFPNFAKTVAYDGTFQEWTEEVEGAGWDYLFGDKDAFNKFFSKEQQLPMLISFSVPALFGGGMQVGSELYFRNKYNNAIEGLRTTLYAQDYDTEDVSEIIASIKDELYTTNVEELPQKIRDIAGTLLGDDVVRARNRFVSRYEELQEKKHLTKSEQDEMVALERFLQNDKTQMMIDCLSQLAGAETALAQINVQTDKERRQAVERARQAEREYGQVPIAQNEWGAVYDWRNRTPQEGADFLMQAQSGYLRGVFHRDGIGDSGDVDMNWGHYKGGLLHMIDKHIIRHADFENVEDLMKTLNNLISNGDVEKRDSDGKWIINDDNYTAVIAADDNGNWALTSFDSTRAQKDKERTPEAQEAKRKELGIATLSDSDETANADEERTLVPQTENQLETSDDKDTATISPTQEEQINYLQKQYEQDKQNYPALFGELSFEQYLESLRDENIRRNEEAEDHNLFDEEVELYQSALDYVRHQQPSATQQFANRATQEVTQKYADIKHNDGKVYQVSDPANPKRKGYIVGNVPPIIDNSGDNPIITNSDVVTVKWNDRKSDQLPAKNFDLASYGTAQDFINAEVEQHIDQHTAERIENGEKPTLMQKNGQLQGFFPVEGKDGVVEDKYGNQYTPEQLTQDGWQETQPVYFANGANQVVTALDNGDGTYSAIDAMGNVMGERFTQVDMNNQGFLMMPIEQTTETPQSSAPAQEETQETETPSAQQPESQEPIEPNVQTMSPQQLAASAVEFMGSREDAVSWLDMQIEQTQKTLKAAQNLKPKSADALGFRNEMAQIRQAQQTAQTQLDKLNEAKKQANRYRTQSELAQEAADNQRREEEARKAAELREQRRKTEEAQAGTTPAEKWNGSPKVQGNTVTRTLPGGTKIKGHYVLAEAGTATPSHDPFNNWNTSEGFPTTEDGRNINDRDYKTDKDAQQITMQIAQTYDGQAVEQVPVISSDGIVYDGNGRTIAGNIAATNNTDAAYLEALAENAGNFGFTPEQLAQFQHPRVYLQLDEDLPYNTTTFARFNSQEKKTQSSTNRAVNNSKKLTDAARDGLLQIIDNYGTLDTFFASEKGASDVINSILDNGIITQQEVAGLTEQTATGYLLSPAGRDYVTDLLIGALFDEQTIKLLGSDKGLKQSILRALPSIVENRRLGDYSLTDNINGAIRLLYEARRAGMTYGEFIRQTNAFDGAVSDRYSAFEMLLAEEMQAGVEQFRQVLNIYNQSAKDEANGQTGLFEPRTPEDIKQEILNHYAKRNDQHAAEQRTASPQTQPPVPSAQAGDGEQVETKPTFIDALRTIVEKGRAAASEIFQRSFFDVAKTPDFMKELGLTGEKFTIKYGVISRHFGKDESHNLPIDVWEQLPEALQHPFAITKYYEDESKQRQKGYRLYTTLQMPDNSYVVVSAEVKSAGKEIEVNAINTIFGRDAISAIHDELIYTAENITPDQQSLLVGNNPQQYPAEREYNMSETSTLTTPESTTKAGLSPSTDFSADKDTTNSATTQDGSEKKSEEQPKDQPKSESKNTIFTDEEAERVRARMRARRNRLNMGIDPEQFADGVFMAGYYVEKGMRKFADYARAMIQEFGDWVRPYLKQWYMGLRYDPRAVGQEFLKDMDDINTVDKFDVDNFKVEEPKTEKKPQASLQPWDSTPMGVQYHKIKEQYPDALLLFRVGDFYEVYDTDAQDASDILGITLTKNKAYGNVPMAGFPFHDLDTYLPKLVRAGKRVAICDQLEDPKKAKNKVKTGLTELNAPENNTEKPLQTENNAVPLQGEEPTAENPNRVIRHIGEIRKSKHTQTGEDLWIVNPTDRVSDEEFKQLKARARNNNGYYSSFKANKGFIFKSEEDANNFNNIEDERTTDETAANTTAIAEQGQAVAGEAAAIEPDRGRESEAAGEQRTDGDTPSVGGVGTVEEKTPEEREQTITTAQRAIDKIDEMVEKHDEQLALLGYYAADTNNPSKFHEVYGYRRTAENKAIADADRLAKQLAEDLGIKLESKRKKLATANIPPAGGEITFRLPLENGNELFLQIDIAPNESWRAFYRQDGSEDDLHVTGLVWRIANPSKNGSSRYVTDFSRFGIAANGFNLTYRALLQDIRTRAKNYLPQAEIAPNTTRNEIVAQAVEKQKKRKADKNAIQNSQPVLDLFADAVEDLNSSNADPVAELVDMYNQDMEEWGRPDRKIGHNPQSVNTNNNGDTEVRNDGQRESRTPQGRTAGQPADENGTLGGSQRQTDEGTDTRGVGARGEQHRLHDGERGLGTTGQRTSESVERKQSLRLRYLDEFGVEHILDANYYTLGDVYHINDRLNGEQYNVKASNVLKNIKKKVWTEIVDTPTQETEAPIVEGERKNTRNFRYDPADTAPTSNKARYEANLAAIRLLKQLQDDGRQATPEEQRVLAKFTGWGGLGEFFKGEPGTTYYSHGEKSPYQTIKELLTDEEMEAAQLSRNSAYYTPAPVIDRLWDIAKQLGFKGGNILEGSAGIGNILAQMPQSISDRSSLQAVEIDPITAGILAQLYPDAQTHAAGFQEVNLPNNSQDLVITNVPFVTGLRVYDKQEKDLSKRFGNIHDFCIAKNVRKLRQGGLGIFITSSGTLDSSKDLRRWLNNEGETDVIGAFRMNRETFGGTSVTSDIIVVRKRVNGQKDPRAIDVLDTMTDRVAKQEQEETWNRKKGQWETPEAKEVKLVYNKYFVEHPEAMGGVMGFGFEHGDTRWGGTTAGCYADPTIDQNKRLQQWVESLKQSDNLPTYTELEQGTLVPSGTYERYEGAVPYGTLILNSKGQICKAYHGEAIPVEGINPTKVKGHTKAEVLKDYNAIKSALDELLTAQTKDISDAELKPYLQKLNNAYNTFTRKYGNLNRNVSLSFLRNDVQWASISALEDVKETVDANGKKKVEVNKTDVFTKRVVGVMPQPKAETTKDGVILSVQQFGVIRPDKIAEWLNKPAEEVEREIIESRLGFKDPQTGNIQVRHEYLSGNVREKLAYAEEHNENGEYNTNIDELRKVIPIDIPAHLIEFNIGSTWIPTELYQEYLKDKFDVTGIKLTHVGSAWVAGDLPWSGKNEKNRSEGVYSEKLGEQVYGSDLMIAAMNNVPLVVSRTEKHRDGTTETITDKEATAACSDKISQIKDDFVEWARGKMQQDSELAERVQKIYNDRFNAIVPMMKVDDIFLSEHLPGQNHKYELYKHQQNAVVRATTQPIMLAHEVGTGKTITLISTAMEMRRLGTAKKPMIVVQNATTPQFVKEAKDLYPNAKILTVSERDRTREGRQEFYAKIKYNDWDLIIVPQSVFDMIPDSEGRMRDFVWEKIDEKQHAIEAAKEAGLDKKITNRMEKELDNLYEDLETNNMSGKRGKKATEKDAKKAAEQRANAEARAQAMLDRKTDDVADFDDMGIDALLIDEAHNYKHLGFSTMMTRGVKGIDPSYSKRAAALYLKCQSIYERSGHRNVVFATGTPISNTAAEIWTFMKYLLPKEVLKDNDIYYFDDFVHNFGKINEQLEFQTNGKFKPNNRFSQYGNVPELMRMWLSCADCVLTREVGQVNDKVPEIENGGAQDIFLPQSPSLIDIMATVRAELERYENMSGKEKKENSHIPLTMYGIAKRAAIDPRLVDANAADEPLSKTNKAVEEVLRSLNDSKKYNGTAAIFCDSYQNKQSGFNLFQDIKDKLVKNGVPASKIAIIRSDMTDTAKQKIFDAVREGEIRVIMGSTQTLGTGVNIQTRLHTLIHMDAPDRPMDYTQRNGRIVRQGNMHKQWNIPVRILRFGVEDSLDVTSYQRLKTKAGFIDSIMNGKAMIDNNLENRVLEDVEEGIFDNPVAMLSGSQYALLKTQAERDLRKWSARKQQHNIDQILITDRLKKNGMIMQHRRNVIAQNEKFMQQLEQQFPNGKVDEYNIDGTICHNADELKAALKELNADIQARADKLRKEGYDGDKQSVSLTLVFNGVPFNVDILLTRKSSFKDGSRIISVDKEVHYSVQGGERIVSPTKVLDKLVEHIEQEHLSGKQARTDIKYSQDYIVRLEKENELMRQREGKPFAHEEELQKAQQLVDEYTEKMKEELAAKEAKYANLASGKKVELNEETDEEETDTPEAQYDELEYSSRELTEAERLAAQAEVESLLNNAGLQVTLDADEAEMPNDAETEFSIRQQPAPKNTGIGYKVFYRGKDGKLYPPMVANPNGEDTPIGVWLDADAAPIAGESKTGRPQVKAGGKGTQGGSGQLAYRPGWHLGEIPYALQFNRKDEEGNKTLFPKDFVWAEVEYAADVDYQQEAEQEGMTESGKYRHSYAGLKHLPTNGFYRYRTNPNPETDPWIITGAMKVNRVLSNKEVDEIVRAAGREPQRREGDVPELSFRTDRDGFQIGDGTWHMPYEVRQFPDYPQIEARVSKASTTESVYVTYTNKNNGASVKVRFSGHMSNNARWGVDLPGFAAENGQILERLGLAKREWQGNSYVPVRSISKAELAAGNYEVADKTRAELSQLPIGTDISEYKGKLVPDMTNNAIYTSDKVVEDQYNGRRIYRDNDGNIIPSGRTREAMLTPNGTLYGWAIGDRIYLTKDGFNPNTPVHEYSHLWIKAIRKNNRELYDNLMDLFSRKNLPQMYEELDNDPNYADLSEEGKMSEVFARFSGKRGAQRMTEEAQAMLDEAVESGSRKKVAQTATLIQQMKALLKKAWDWIGEHLFNIKNFGSREEAADRALYDMLNGTELNLDNSDRQVEKQVAPTTPPQTRRQVFVKAMIDRANALNDELKAAVVRNADGENTEEIHRLQKGYADYMQSALKEMQNDIKGRIEAQRLQKTYDKGTIDALSAYANMFIQSGWAEEATKTELARLIGTINNGATQTDIVPAVQKMLNLFTNTQLRQTEKIFDRLLKTPLHKLNISGVREQGKVDIRTQYQLDEIKTLLGQKGITYDKIEEHISDLQDKVEEYANDDTLREEYSARLDGAFIALQFFSADGVVDKQQEAETLKQELKDAQADKSLSRQEKQELIASIEQAMLENEQDQIIAYQQMNALVADILENGRGRAKSFLAEQKARQAEIHHYANSDLKGVSAQIHRTDTREQRLMNSPLVSGGLFSPLASLNSMLKRLAPNALNGRGYMYNHFIYGITEAAENEYLGLKQAFQELDDKVSEIWGKKMTFADAERELRNAPKIKVTVYDAGLDEDGKATRESREIQLTQAQVAYLYMVNKMTDGKMKLRKMGVTEEDIEKIKKHLDPKLIQLCDWLQNEYLTLKRNKYNAVHEQMFGAPMAAIENYFPLRIVQTKTNKKEDVADNNAGKGQTRGTMTGAIKQRVRNSLPLDIIHSDIFSVMIDHLQEMEHWAAYAQITRDTNQLLSYNTFKNKLNNMSTVYGAGKQLFTHLKDAFRLALGTYEAKQDPASAFTAQVAKGLSIGAISLRMSTAVKQLLSHPAYWTELTHPTFALEYGKNLIHPYGAVKWALDNLPLLHKRWNSRAAGDTRILDNEDEWRYWHNHVVEWCTRIGMSPNAFIDMVTCAQGAKAYYELKRKEYIEAGMPQEDAEKRARQDAEIFFNETQQSSEGAFIAPIQRDRSWSAIIASLFNNANFAYTRRTIEHLTQFISQIRNKNKVIEFNTKLYQRAYNMDEDTARAKAEKEYKHAIARNLIGIAIFGYFIQQVWRIGGNWLYMIIGDDDDEKKKMIEDASLGGGLATPVRGIIGGKSIEALLDVYQNGWQVKLQNNSPLEQDINKILEDLQYDRYAETVNDIVDVLVGSTTGIRPITISNIVIGIYDTVHALSDDNTKNDIETTREIAMLFGRAMSVPQSQLDKIYIDELGCTAQDIQRIIQGGDTNKVNALAQRYIEYHKLTQLPLTAGNTFDEEQDNKLNKKALNKFMTRLKDRYTLHHTQEED